MILGMDARRPRALGRLGAVLWQTVVPSSVRSGIRCEVTTMALNVAGLWYLVIPQATSVRAGVEGHAEVKREGVREVCFFCEAARPVDCLVASGSGRLIHTCHSCSKFLLTTNLVYS